MKKRKYACMNGLNIVQQYFFTKKWKSIFGNFSKVNDIVEN